MKQSNLELLVVGKRDMVVFKHTLFYGGVALLLMGGPSYGYTAEDQVAALVKFRDAMLQRGPHWGDALWSWTCPTDQANSDQECDPCGREAWGNWEHIGCRGAPLVNTPWEFQVPGDGMVTDVHITDYKIEGNVPTDELCAFSKLRQFDVDGGWLTGSIPSNFHKCFPDLLEIDLSFNNLTGTLPAEIALNQNLQEFKIEFNDVGGSLPPEFGNLKSLRWLRLHVNALNGTIPKEWAGTQELLQQITVDENDFEGNLYALKDHSLSNFSPQYNPKLCGMVPIGLRYAHGFNYHDTGLGLPCPDEIENGI